MKNIRVIVGVTALGIVLAVGCGDDTKSTTPTPGAGGDGSGGDSGGSGGSGGKTGGGTNSVGGQPGSDGGVPSSAGMPGTGEAGMGGGGPGCGDGPACDENIAECVSGQCLLVDGEACQANEDCLHTCINEECAPRSEVLGDCDYQGAGGAGGAGGGGGGGAGGGAEGGSGGEGGESIFVPPEEKGNGDDLDCLDGLACDSGTCKRKQMTDCTGPEQCLSGLCHKSKCTLGPADAGICEAALCGAPDTNLVCAPTTTAVNNCSFNYLPNSSCTVDFKGTYCYQSCACQLAP